MFIRCKSDCQLYFYNEKNKSINIDGMRHDDNNDLYSF